MNTHMALRMVIGERENKVQPKKEKKRKGKQNFQNGRRGMYLLGSNVHKFSHMGSS